MKPPFPIIPEGLPVFALQDNHVVGEWREQLDLVTRFPQGAQQDAHG
jgi:hypothetical protein